MASSLSSISEILSSRRINEGTSMIFKTLGKPSARLTFTGGVLHIFSISRVVCHSGVLTMSLRRIASKALRGRQIDTSSLFFVATIRREFSTSMTKKSRRERKHAISGLIYTANKVEAVVLPNTLQEYTEKEQRYFGYVMWINLGLGLGTWAFIRNRKTTYST